MSNLFFSPEKPKVPEYKPIDVTAEQAKSLQGNLQNFGLITQLAQKSNELGISQGLNQIDAMYGGPELRTLINKNLVAAARGEIPSDVQEQMKRWGAEAGYGSGAGTNSVFNQYRQLRDLGLTSLQQTQYAQQAAVQWGQFAGSRMPMYDFTSAYTNWQAMTEAAFRNTENQFNRDWMQNQINAEFSRKTQVANAMADFDAAITQMAISYVGSMGGGGGGGGSFTPTRQSSSNISPGPSAAPANTFSTDNASYNTYGLPTDFAPYAQF